MCADVPDPEEAVGVCDFVFEGVECFQQLEVCNTCFWGWKSAFSLCAEFAVQTGEGPVDVGVADFQGFEGCGCGGKGRFGILLVCVALGCLEGLLGLGVGCVGVGWGPA